ncbi:hypothetical protein ACFQ6N_22485 [Kitasatospora sp. NPDC056446]|uniref:hypothetical protein n=1 Tax=Kitasatospora sp. NPDC056446 TaxID=3345819 RepID=UPI00369554E5
MTDPEFLPASWTHFLGGPVPYGDQDDQEAEAGAPTLEPIPDSPTMARIREAMDKANWRSRWGI